ncbi:oxidation resistance protein 1-like [Actinia tenebrosa]|uniref:Oxidation resistance protein 1 n=1 Tax=Actinia tenebrosa TaxID=6105 RepID=A0A6P8IUT9_ACTTE|nr:oxidation resistance protein 1-like [Actinia tenebrosa]
MGCVTSYNPCRSEKLNKTEAVRQNITVHLSETSKMINDSSIPLVSFRRCGTAHEDDSKSRKPTEDDSNDGVNNEDGSSELIPSHRSQQEKSSQSSSYGRFLSWGLEGVSYLGGQLKQRVERSLLWVSPETDFQVEDKIAINMRRTNQKPEGAVEYSVGSSDTLAKIALRFDTTPSELTRMNKLPSRMLFPGQVLYVPEKKPAEESSVENNHAHPKETKKPLIRDHHSSTQGHHEQIKLTKKVSLLSDDEEEITESFLKIKAKYITDGQGVVNGVMLVTPQSVIFNPNVSEPLVMDRGRDRYSIKTPMSAVSSAALFKDIAAMAVHDPLKAGRFYLDDETIESVSHQNSAEMDLTNTSSPLNKPTKLHSNLVPSKNGDKKKLNNSKTTHGLNEPLPPSIQDRGGLSTATGDNKHDVDKGGSKTLGDVPEEIKQIVQELLNDLISDVVDGVVNEQKTEFVEGFASSKHEHSVLDSTSHVDKDCNSLSPASEDSGICSPQNKWNQYQGTKSGRDQDDSCKKGLDGNGPNEGLAAHLNKGHLENCDHDTSHDSVIDSVSTASLASDDNKRSSSFLSSLSGEVKYWLGVGHRNQVEDDHAYEEEIIPRPAASAAADDQLLYLCIRISKKHWCMCLAAGGHNSQEGESLMDRDRRRREYWFAIPAARADHVYGFFKQYCPNINRTLSLSEEEPEEDEEPVEDEEEEAVQFVDGFYSCTPPKAKVLVPFSKIGKELILDVCQPNSNLEQGSVKSPDSLSDDIAFLPEMSDDSQILSKSLVKKLNKNLPSRLVGHTWTLVYSTFLHGFSLKTMYRNMEDFDTPMLIVVQDDEHQIFGTVTSCPLRISEGFYGTGQSFLFKFEGDEIKTFLWRGDNDFFMKGSVDCIAFGSGGGQFGLWLDEDFYHGSSHFSETYHNETLSKNEDFLCSAVEAWGFI